MQRYKRTFWLPALGGAFAAAATFAVGAWVDALFAPAENHFRAAVVARSAPAPTEVAIVPSRIEVVGDRTQKLARTASGPLFWGWSKG
jgi:hypothetical protein